MATVGVQGDRRSYSHLVALSGNEKPDNWAELSALANEIPRKIRGVNRVVFASGEKVDGIIEGVTETHINHSGIDLWRKVDHVIRTVLVKYGLNRSDVISEVPIILTALSYETKGSRAVGIRPFITEDYMTGEAAIPGESFPLEAYYEIVEKVTAMRGINRLLYDLSDKPPGTTQWR
jgi:GMP synthase (glutamine-hydrolysing)